MRTLSKRIQTLQKKLDRLVQIKYVPLNPWCIVCGKPTSEMHHFVQKRASTYLRYHEDNLIPLCKKCHCKHHTSGDPTIVSMIIIKKGQDWFSWIEAHRHIVVKRNLDYEKKLNTLTNNND